jgi:uncharacterized protein YlxW (UPF0749 family)
MKNKTVLGLALLSALLLVGLVLTFLRVSDLKTTVADLETSTNQQITELEASTNQQIAELETEITNLETTVSELETSTNQQIEDLENTASQFCTDLEEQNRNVLTPSIRARHYITWDCEFSDQ